jgi:hypothetical protein
MERIREAAVVLVALLATYAAAPPRPLDPAFAQSTEIRSELSRVVVGIGSAMSTGSEAAAATAP